MTDARRDLVDQEASAWVVLAGDRALTPEEQGRLEAWRAADPLHESTYSSLLRTWQEIPALGDLAELAPAGEKAAELPPASRSRPVRRVNVALSAAAAALLALLFATGWLAQAPQPTRYETALAQTRRIALPDGSVATLGPRSSLILAYSGEERRVRLAGGEAFFEISNDAQRPFLVEAGPSTVRVTGTKFDVRFGAGRIRVAVLEGSVEIRGRGGRDPAMAASRLLRAGDEAEIVLAESEAAPTAGAAHAIAIAVASPAQRAGAWREGRRAYQNARLADVVADMNRYYPPGVRLADDGVGDLRITTSFRTSEIPAFMAALPDVVPVTAEEGEDGAFRVAADPR